MSSLSWIINTFLHVDQALAQIVVQYGIWTYGILFVVIFIETGLVICPFLPGDSLLFVTGAIAAHNSSGINLLALIILIIFAAVLGATVNYWIGREIGQGLKKHHLFVKLISEEQMERAEKFFDKHGGFAVFLGRFIPFIRTFIPFIAGGSRMRYSYFFLYNVVGGSVWTLIGLFVGYFFGQIPVIKGNYSLIMLMIVFISLIPILLIWLKKFFLKKTRQS
ncbi:VTT domain-containing protein [Sporolactobacillus pectinivorans]|uniref:VTT domain-containing protein n=1 Tax=Sporolactobacillus pectinivorans TaxID=1591408 RepID=UPI000C25FF7F|nr:VTT domain-containing protein [Sporolactobacillus pectinivorans]